MKQLDVARNQLKDYKKEVTKLKAQLNSKSGYEK